MDDEISLNPHRTKLACWVCVFVLLFIVFPSPLCQKQKCPQAAFSAGADHQVMVREVQQAEKTDMRRGNYVVPRYVVKRQHLFHPIIQKAADRYEIDPALVKAIIMVESSYNPKAVSSKGAMGLMQLMPGTARALGVEDGFNPEHNIEAGVKYLRQLINRFDGDTKLALAAYNAGIRKVRKHAGIPPYKATQYYVKKVFEYYRYYKEIMTGSSNKA